MFTGIIEAIGKVSNITPKGGDKFLKINTSKLDMSDVALGDSIAVNGVCLTVVEFDDNSFTADVSAETINRSTFSHIEINSKVNLEKAMALGDRLGGHLVSGHVDGIGEVIDKQQDARSWRFTIRAPESVAHYIAEKGSITIDGTSLTVNAVSKSDFDVNIVPHTMQETIMSEYKTGTKVNLEVDLIARYLERLLLKGNIGNEGSSLKETSITESMLRENGFI